MGSNSHWNDYIAGAVSGCAGIVVGHPFDTVKVQLQTKLGISQYSGLVDCIRNVSKQGLRDGFFRGMSWPLLSSGIINSVFLGVYGTTMKVMNDGVSNNGNPNFSHIICAAGVGGFVQLIPACPVEVVKVVLQSQIPHTVDTLGKPLHSRNGANKVFFKGPIQAAAIIIKSQGLRGLYRGLHIQMLRDIPASCAYLSIYEYMTHKGKRLSNGKARQFINFIAGGFAGVISWAIILPFDVIKSRYQSDVHSQHYRSLSQCASECYRNEGISGFFRGFWPTSLRAFPVNAVILMVYAECLMLLNEEKYQV